MRHSWVNVRHFGIVGIQLPGRWGSALKGKADLRGKQKPDHKVLYILPRNLGL